MLWRQLGTLLTSLSTDLTIVVGVRPTIDRQAQGAFKVSKVKDGFE
jgi:hypothetical protein